MTIQLNKHNSIKQPLNQGRAKVPMIMQMEALECGAACLAMVMAYYQKWIPLEQVRLDCGVSRDGSKAKNIVLAARRYGFTADGYRMEVNSIKEDGLFPCIIHWNFNHFVVLNGFHGNKAYINDPARGCLQISMEEFDTSFTGVCLIIQPGENFVPSGKKKSTLSFARQRLKGAGATIAFVLLTAIIAYSFEIINPVMTRIFFDRLLTGIDRNWLNSFTLVMVILCSIQLLVEWIQTIYRLKIDGKMAAVGNSSYIWKVLRLPLEFFSQRMAGDLMQRQSTNASIAGTLVNTLAPLGLSTLMMFFYLFVLIRYNLFLTMIGLISLCLNLLFARIISNKRINLTRVQVRDAGKLNSTTLAGISMAETIKASGAENGFFQKWSGYQASVNTQTSKFTKMNATLGLLPSLINITSNYLVLFIGVRLAMDGQFSLGMIVTFQMILGSFMSPAKTLISAGQTIQEMRTQMERIEDVMQYPTDPFLTEDHPDLSIDLSKLKGQIDVKNVTFGYSKLAEPVIKDFSMTITPGSRIAIIGASGCGKSTISKLISGLYQPWSGEILFDNKSINQIPRSVFTGSVAVVDQDIILFEDTIGNNIKMWDESIADFEVILAARDAQIHDDIMLRPGGYQNKLTENGKDLSGGQRQRLEIARVLAQDPTILILDEATSALDAQTEYDVVNAIRNRGITCIIIAHRLSTIRDCDEIIVLDKGIVVERGTHDVLMSRGGLYSELVTNE